MVLVVKNPATSTFGISGLRRIRSGIIDIQYCPTEDMLADYFTKPLLLYTAPYLKKIDRSSCGMGTNFGIAK